MSPVHSKDQQKILAARRQAMTKARSSVEMKTVEVVEFILGANNYAFMLEQIREICPVTGLTHIPGSPAYALGVINLRGEIVPILDLQTFVGLNTPSHGLSAARSSDAKAMVFEKGELVVGFLADEVLGAEKIPDFTLKHAVETICGINAEFISAVTSERLVLLNAERLLADPRLRPTADAQAGTV